MNRRSFSLALIAFSAVFLILVWIGAWQEHQLLVATAGTLGGAVTALVLLHVVRGGGL